MNEPKFRVDQLLVHQGLTSSREQGKRLIMAGQVHMVDASGTAHRIEKPGTMLPGNVRLHIQAHERFVSRGGEKLATAMDHFQLRVQGLVALDVGASTGGFTDCLLQAGVTRVYAVDVGYGQLHWRLRNDPRVVVMERINVRHAGPELIPELVDLVVVDCSFISLTRILPPCLAWMRPGALVCALIKPQFELPRGSTVKGVVRSPELEEEAVSGVVAFAQDLGLVCHGHIPSRVRGPKGNQEYLALFAR
ncbi:MAG: TlyA family RNA methyltransferase [Desulfovermiculus sp.]|nr:TlyA family RNA methyltransferase [Desulfovermiculus sp.]